MLTFEVWKDKIKFAQDSKKLNATPENNNNNEQNNFEKTLVVEDEKVSKGLNEKKLKRKVLAERNTGLKEAAKKCRKSAATEKELWDRLDTLNKKFVQAKEHK